MDSRQPSELQLPVCANDRRDFLKRLGMIVGGLTLVGTAAPLLESCSDPLPTGIKAGNTAASITISVALLDTNGKALVTSDVGPDGATIVVYRQSAGVFQAHSMACTHAGCNLNAPVGTTMSCPCHGSQFTTQGQVLSRPAVGNLPSYATTYDAGTDSLTIKFK